MALFTVAAHSDSSRVDWSTLRAALGIEPTLMLDKPQAGFLEAEGSRRKMQQQFDCAESLASLAAVWPEGRRSSTSNCPPQLGQTVATLQKCTVKGGKISVNLRLASEHLVAISQMQRHRHAGIMVEDLFTIYAILFGRLSHFTWI